MEIVHKTETRNSENKKDKKDKKRINENENGLLLDCTIFSNVWQETLDDASPYMPTKSSYPSLVIPIPDREDCLIISDNECFYSPQQTFATLRSYEQVFETFNYALWVRALKRFKFAGARLLPMVNRTSCLFPVSTSIQHALWIDPLKIYDVHKCNHMTRLIMIDGTTVESFVSRRTLNMRSTYALLALATIRRDYLHTDIQGERPLDYLNIPNTPFLRSLSKRPSLHKFTVPVNDLKRQYEIERLIHEIINLGRRAKIKGLTYNSLYKLLK